MKINILKTLLFTLVVSFLMFMSLADSVEAYWQCNDPRDTTDYDYVFQWDSQTRAEIIRFRHPSAGASVSGWGDNCVEDCTNPAGCGSCECRCQGEDLYCADIWGWTSRGVPRTATQTCSWNLKSSYDSQCIPSEHSITSPANGSFHELGSNILFEGKAKDGNEEDLTFHWVIRTVANTAARNYSQDIVETNTVSGGSGFRYDSFNKNNLPVEDYYVFLAVENKQGVYAKNADGYNWNYVRFDVGKTATCGTANNKNYAYSTEGYGADTQCAIGSSSNTNFPAAGGSINWTCSGINGGSSSGTCSASRQAAATTCPDGACNGSENCSTCPQDCGTCPSGNQDISNWIEVPAN